MSKPGPEVKVDLDEILLRFVLSPDPVLIASEIARPYDITRQTAANYLERLEDDGLLRSKSAGNRRMFWITYEGRGRVANVFADEIFDYLSDNHQP
jgi:predicted transcriptional regulator